MNINTVCVCGAGTMGTGIAQAITQSGFHVLLYEPAGAVLEKARTAIDKNLQLLTEKGKIPAGDKEKILQRIRYTDDVQTCLADLFIEAIVEKEEIKISLFNQLAELNHGEGILASNTSSLSITRIAEKVINTARGIGMHFFNPATI